MFVHILQVICLERVENGQVLVHLEKTGKEYCDIRRFDLKVAKILMDWEDCPKLGEYFNISVEK